jgi:hypothetical protein
MWSNIVVDFAFGEESSIPEDKKFLNKIKEPKTANQNIWAKNTKSENSFYDNVLYNRDIVLYVQRQFIATSEYFDDTFFELDDANVPFDYDHISPKIYTGKNKNALPKPLKEIYNTPCNLRVWPYTLNRSDCDKIPAEKFTNNNYLHNSFCSENWKEYSRDWLDNEKITKKSEWKKIYSLLWERWRDMYEELENQLRFKKLAAKPNNEIHYWKDVAKGDLWEKDLKAEDGKNWYRLLIEKDLYFYIYQPDEEDDFSFQFGVYGDTSRLSGYSGKYNKESFKSPIDKDGDKEKFWIFEDKRLSCPCIEGYRDLYNTIKKWLNGLKYSGVGSRAIEKLDKCLIPELL